MWEGVPTGDPRHMLRSAVRAGMALLAWLAVVVCLTWPLADFAATHMLRGAACDTFYSVWALAWQSHALVSAPARLFDANIYHPVPEALAYGPMGTGALPLFGPAFAATGNPVWAANVLFVGGSALTAWTIGLVATRWTRLAAAGVIAGSTYLAAPWVLHEWVPRVPHFAMLMWVPLIIDRASRPSLRLRDGLALAAMIAAQGAVEIVYVAPAVFAPLALIAVVRLVRRSTRVSALYLGGALIAAAIALSPLVSAHLAVRRANPGLAQQTTPWGDDKGSVSTDAPVATAPVVPPSAPVVPWSLFGWWRQAGGVLAAPPPMAIPPLAFGLIGCGVLSRAVRRRWSIDGRDVRAWRHAALWAMAGMVLGLPPVGAVFGTIVTLPPQWLYEMLPIARTIRVPMRLGVVGLVGLSLLTGLAFGEVVGWGLRRWRADSRARVACGLLAAVFAWALLEQPRTGVGYPPGFVVVPRPRRNALQKIPVVRPYTAILRAGDGPLLEIGAGVFAPPTVRPWFESIAMLRSIGHWRPLLNGYSSYWPEQYERSLELARRLPEDLDALHALRAEAGVQLLLVFPLELPQRKREAWDALARSGGSPSLALVGRGERAALLFRVTASDG